MINKSDTVLGVGAGLFVVYLVVSLFAFMFGIGPSYKEKKCSPQNMLQVLVPAYGLGCLLVKPFSEYTK